MKKIYFRRTVRNLKKNFTRYLALFFLIAFGMYMIVSLAGGADIVEHTVYHYAAYNQIEDGEFTTFIPLSDKELEELDELGAIVEEKFSLDYSMEDGSVLRVFADRENINRVQLDDGTLPTNDLEIVIEKKYAQAHDIQIGDSLILGESDFKVVGIGSTPDYDCVLDSLSDSTTQSEIFGTAFVSKSQFQDLEEAGTSAKAETYEYSYLCGDDITDDEVKSYLRELKIDASDVADVYFQDYYQSEIAGITEMESALTELQDGAGQQKDGLETLESYSESLKEAANAMLLQVLSAANSEIKSYGVNTELTEENYSDILGEMSVQGEGTAIAEEAVLLQERISQMIEFRDNLSEYIDGVAESAAGAGSLLDGIQEINNQFNAIIDDSDIGSISNLVSFTTQEDNARIYASIDDVLILKYAGLWAGIFVLLIFTYIISVFVVHTIETESTVIGVLYAMGVKKREIIAQYLWLPAIVAFLGGICGTLVGFSPIGAYMMGGSNSAYYSIPELIAVYPLYLIIYGIVLPPVIALLVNYFVINKKLSDTALHMIRNERKTKQKFTPKITKGKFIRIFQMRLFYRESRACITIILGIFLSVFILMLGIDCYTVCSNMRYDNEDDVKFNYMYIYKYPSQEPGNENAAYVETLHREIYGYDFEVLVLGIDEKNPYFSFTPETGTTKLTVSTSVAEKYNLKVGDEFILRDETTDSAYVFEVADIVQYSVGLYVFMDIESMRDLFGRSDDYYNVVFSDSELTEIEGGRLYNTITREEILESADVFIEIMQDMIVMMIGISVVIFVMIMYLMQSAIIGHSQQSISLFKVLGYRDREIQMLFLDGNTIVVAVSAAICIALCKIIVDIIYPICFVANVSAGLDYSCKWYIYLAMYVGIMITYQCTNLALMKGIKSVSMAEILKNRE